MCCCAGQPPGGGRKFWIHAGGSPGCGAGAASHGAASGGDADPSRLPLYCRCCSTAGRNGAGCCVGWATVVAPAGRRCCCCLCGGCCCDAGEDGLQAFCGWGAAGLRPELMDRSAAANEVGDSSSSQSSAASRSTPSSVPRCHCAAFLCGGVAGMPGCGAAALAGCCGTFAGCWAGVSLAWHLVSQLGLAAMGWADPRAAAVCCVEPCAEPAAADAYLSIIMAGFADTAAVNRPICELTPACCALGSGGWIEGAALGCAAPRHSPAKLCCVPTNPGSGTSAACSKAADRADAAAAGATAAGCLPATLPALLGCGGFSPAEPPAPNRLPPCTAAAECIETTLACCRAAFCALGCAGALACRPVSAGLPPRGCLVLGNGGGLSSSRLMGGLPGGSGGAGVRGSGGPRAGVSSSSRLMVMGGLPGGGGGGVAGVASPGSGSAAKFAARGNAPPGGAGLP